MFGRRKKKETEAGGNTTAPPRGVRKLLTPRGRETPRGAESTPRSQLRPPTAQQVASTGGKAYRGTPAAGLRGSGGSPTGQTPREALAFESPERPLPNIIEDSPSNNADNVKVLVRIRPPNPRELQSDYATYAFRQGRSVILKEPEGYPDTRRYTFDTILGEESSQEDVFIVAGLPVVENCISGYNSSVFCYGQTGAGKTFTMQGNTREGQLASEDAGLMPRVFDHVFKRIAEEEDRKGRDNLKYSIRCSFLQIYNEQISDLLRPSSTNLMIREDHRHGCYVEGLSEQAVLNGSDMMHLLKKGIENRRVSETKMNAHSSRSHSVLTCIIEGRTKGANGMTVSKYSRLNLIDLAGSERNKLSGAEGEQLKEAANINKSLSTLGRVIMNLVDQQCGKRVHVPYRDSRLTFLLQDSLGGNAKTFMIANVSPSVCCASETLSTLRFAHSAKSIVNKAVVNEEASGDIAQLQSVIKQLRGELEMFHEGTADPFVELKQRLESVETERSQAQSALDSKLGENKQLQKRVEWLEKQLEDAESNREKYEEVHATVSARMVSLEKQLVEANQVAEAVKAAEVDFLLGRLGEKEREVCQERAVSEALEVKHRETLKSLDAMGRELEEERAKVGELEAERDAAADERDALATSIEEQKAEISNLGQALEKAEGKGKAADKLAKARAEELRKVQKTLETVEAVAQGHEQELLHEIGQLERELKERNDAIQNIFRVAETNLTPVRTERSPLSSALGSRTRPSHLRLASPNSASYSTRSRQHRVRTPESEAVRVSSPVTASRLLAPKSSSPLPSPATGNRTPLSDATNCFTKLRHSNSSKPTTPTAHVATTAGKGGNEGSGEFFTPLSDTAAAGGTPSRAVSAVPMTPFEDARGHTNDDISDSESDASGTTETDSDEQGADEEDEEEVDHQRIGSVSSRPPSSAKHAGVRISTCNLVYSNPMPVSPHTGRHITSCDSPSSWPLLSGELAASTEDKENGHHALVRASTVLRQKAAFAAAPPPPAADHSSSR